MGSQRVGHDLVTEKSKHSNIDIYTCGKNIVYMSKAARIHEWFVVTEDTHPEYTSSPNTSNSNLAC